LKVLLKLCQLLGQDTILLLCQIGLAFTKEMGYNFSSNLYFQQAKKLITKTVSEDIKFYYNLIYAEYKYLIGQSPKNWLQNIINKNKNENKWKNLLINKTMIQTECFLGDER
jgi:hypothetical protein